MLKANRRVKVKLIYTKLSDMFKVYTRAKLQNALSKVLKPIIELKLHKTHLTHIKKPTEKKKQK